MSPTPNWRKLKDEATKAPDLRLRLQDIVCKIEASVGWILSGVKIKNTYISPLLDLDFRHVFDGDSKSVSVSDPGIHDPKSSFAQNRPNFVQLLERFTRRPEHFYWCLKEKRNF